MILRVLFGALIAAVLMFVWGFVFWGISGIPEPYMNTITESETEAVGGTLPTSGLYVSAPSEDMSAAPKPFAFVVYHAEGEQMLKTMAWGYGHMFVSALLSGMILATVGLPTYFQRMMLLFWVGIFTATFAKLSDAIWWHYPWSYCWLGFLYVSVSCLLMALVMAAVVRPSGEAA